MFVPPRHQSGGPLTLNFRATSTRRKEIVSEGRFNKAQVSSVRKCFVMSGYMVWETVGQRCEFEPRQIIYPLALGMAIILFYFIPLE